MPNVTSLFKKLRQSYPVSRATLSLRGHIPFRDKYGNRYALPRWQRWQRTLSKGVHTDDEGQIAAIRSLLSQLTRKAERVVVIDVGACVGAVGISAASALRSSDRVFCLEPAPENYSWLVKNISLNPELSDRIVPVNAAISDYSGSALLDLDPDNYGGHSLTSGNDDTDPDTERVPCFTLDEFCSERDIEDIAVLKIDTEGHEQRIVRSAAPRFVRQTISAIFLECEQRNEAFLELEEFLRGCGYRLFYIVRDANQVHEVYERWNEHSEKPPLNMLGLRGADISLLADSGITVLSP